MNEDMDLNLVRFSFWERCLILVIVCFGTVINIAGLITTLSWLVERLE